MLQGNVVEEKSVAKVRKVSVVVLACFVVVSFVAGVFVGNDWSVPGVNDAVVPGEVGTKMFDKMEFSGMDTSKMQQFSFTKQFSHMQEMAFMRQFHKMEKLGMKSKFS